MQRRSLLQLLGVGTGLAMARHPAGSQAAASADPGAPAPAHLPPGALPLANDPRSAAEQRRQLTRVTVQDRMVVPEGYQAELVAVWGDSLAAGRFGFNNDYLALLELRGSGAVEREL